jgi:hypothetical protein
MQSAEWLRNISWFDAPIRRRISAGTDLAYRLRPYGSGSSRENGQPEYAIPSRIQIKRIRESASPKPTVHRATEVTEPVDPRIAVRPSDIAARHKDLALQSRAQCRTTDPRQGGKTTGISQPRLRRALLKRNPKRNRERV